MSEILPLVIFIISSILSVLFVGGIIYLIVSLIKNKDEKSKFKISTSLLLNIYLYAISFITLILAVFGGATAIKAGLSYIVDIPFGYNLETVNRIDPAIYGEKEMYEVRECYQGEPTDINGTDYCFDAQQREKDIVNGVTLFVSMLLIFALHQYGIRILKKRYDSIDRIYTFASLVVYGILGVVVIPMAIYQSMNYLLISSDTANLEAPGMAIGLAVLTLPLWIAFLRRNIKERDTE